jgi:hypothetical protein
VVLHPIIALSAETPWLCIIEAFHMCQAARPISQGRRPTLVER